MTETPGLHLEQALWERGIHLVGGIDEAGRGAWAGPVVAGAIILPPDSHIQSDLAGVRDSKKMTPKQREYWVEKIKTIAVAWAIGDASAIEIDTIGILPANRLAMTRAIHSLAIVPEYYLFDFIHWKQCPFPGQKLVRGESQSISIAAASVLAKTGRDAIMRKLDEQFTGYNFSQHKGYGTAIHRAAIEKQGLSPIHRKSFRITPQERGMKAIELFSPALPPE
jgi:ribonuclease HII